MIFDMVPAYLLLTGDLIRGDDEVFEVTHVGYHLDEIAPRIQVRAISRGHTHVFAFDQHRPIPITRRAHR